MQHQVVLILAICASFVSAAVFTVGVGKDETTGKKGVGFDPSVIIPSSGDQILFEFRSGTHSVVESTFEQPCTPKAGGFNSGVKTVPDNVEVDAPGLPTASLDLADNQSRWFFDQAGNTCNQGGVFAVNPTSGSQTAAAFKENAMNATMVPANSSSAADASSTTPTSSLTTASSTQTTQRAPKANAAAAGQVALSSLAGIMLGITIGIL